MKDLGNNYRSDDLLPVIEKAEALAQKKGLTFHPIEFRFSNGQQMQEYIAYHGMPRSRPSWVFGKAIERQRAEERYNLSSTFVYELIAAGKPNRACLRRENSFVGQMLVIAHCFGHADFSHNNDYFAPGRHERLFRRIEYADKRITELRNNPLVGKERVDAIVDAAVAISHQGRRNQLLAGMYRGSKDKHKLEDLKHELGYSLGDRLSLEEEMTSPSPEHPVEDLLLHQRHHNSRLSDWEKDLLDIVYEEAEYFAPILETQILNEGWACRTHYDMMTDWYNEGSISHDMYLGQFLKQHHGVVAPLYQGAAPPNPYFVGFHLYDAIRVWYDGSLDPKLLRGEQDREYFKELQEDYRRIEHTPPDTGVMSGWEKMLELRSWYRDTSALDAFLTYPMMKRMHLFSYLAQIEDGSIITKEQVNRENWEKAKSLLIRFTGENRIPDVRVVDDNYNNKRILYLKHFPLDDRELYVPQMFGVLGHMVRLWKRPVHLETHMKGEQYLFKIRPDDPKINVETL